MRNFTKIIGAAALVATGVAVVAGGGAASAQSRPAAVSCISPVTGPQGGTGPAGATGATGATGPGPSGKARVVHVSGVEAPRCVDLAGVCLANVQLGSGGMIGPTGATGVRGPSFSINGAPRALHVRQVDPCDGVPTDCWYGVQGTQGPTGPIGATGATGPTGPSGVGGPARAAHARPAGEALPVGGTLITLPNCNLPSTGGGSTSMLPYALVLLVLGAGATAIVSRRRVLHRS